LDRQIKKFRKDIDVCLTADDKGRHAYFPALITCIGFADLLSGLHAGKVEGHGLDDLTKYAQRFMNATHYSPQNLAILYECFRHKVAHLNHPYMVFDTRTKPKKFPNQQMRLTWTVCAARRSIPIEIVKYSVPMPLDASRTPWKVEYDHRVKVSVRRFATDVAQSIYGPNGYRQYLNKDSAARTHFERCMNDFYPS
jgi:hypothetical protein